MINMSLAYLFDQAYNVLNVKPPYIYSRPVDVLVSHVDLRHGRFFLAFHAKV